MNRRILAAGYLVLVAGYVVLAVGVVQVSAGLVAWSAIVTLVIDQALASAESGTLLRALRTVAADREWRAVYRQALVAAFLYRSGELSAAAIVTVIAAIVVLHFATAFYAGLDLIVGRKRLRRIETRNLAVPGAHLPAPVPPVLRRVMREVQAGAEILLLAATAYAAASGSYGAVVPASVVMAALALVAPLASLLELVPLLRLPDDELRLEAAQRAVDELQPKVILYFSGGSAAVYQVNMWLETLERLDRPTLVLVRERRYWDRIQQTSVPVLAMPFTADLMNFEFSSVRVGLYVANVGRNLHLLRVPTIKSAFIGHGDSDKSASSNPYAKVYDEVWVAGEAGRDRYLQARVGVRSEDVVVVGRPQLDGLREPGTRSPDKPFTVLYAPTWEGWTDDPFATSIVDLGPHMVQLLLSQPGVRVVFKPHPLTGTVRREAAQARDRITAMLAAAGAPHTSVLDSDAALYDAFDDSDALISDISSVVSDYLRSEKPYFVTNGAGLPDARFRAEYPSARAAYLVGPGGAGLLDGLAAARGDDPLRRSRHDVRRYLLGDPDVPAIELFRRAVDNLAARAEADLPAHLEAVDDTDERRDELGAAGEGFDAVADSRVMSSEEQ